MRVRTLPLRRLVALALFLPLAGCGEGEVPVPGTDDVEGLPAEAPGPPTMEDMVHTTVTLSPVNGSGVSGEAMAMHGDDAIVIMLDLTGLPQEGEYAAHIHIGSCAEGGPVGAALNPVIGLADGTGSSTTTLDAGELNESDRHFVQVHGAGGPPIACGDVEHDDG